MRIAVMSDTHGNIKLFQEMVEFASNELKVKAFWHLGDNYEDCDKVDLHGKYIVRVPGIYHPGYRQGTIDSTISIPFDPFNFLLVHDPSDARGLMLAESNVILHGHTHAPKCSVDHRGRLYLNPGHLKAKRDRGHDAAFMVLTINSGLLVVEHYLSTFELEDDHRFRVVNGKVEEL